MDAGQQSNIEKEILKFWQENQVFEKSVENFELIKLKLTLTSVIF